MCKSICDNFGLKLLMVFALAAFVLDLELLRKTIVEFWQLSRYIDGETYT